MIKWTVVWEESAALSQGNIWFGTGQSSTVTEASYQIDKAMKEDPRTHGSPLSEGLWVVERPPFRVVFTVSDERGCFHDDRRDMTNRNVIKLQKYLFVST